MIKKHLIALFVDTSNTDTPTWTRIKKSTEIAIAMDAQTEEYDYIADEIPTTELEQYKPSIDQPLKMLENEPDFQYFWDLFYHMRIGEEAKTKCMIVFLFDNKGTSESPAYSAWSGECTIAFDEMNGNDSELSFNLALGADTKIGTATVTGTAPDYVPTFTEGEG